MDNKFQNKYRIPSARLYEYDYSLQGAYFITICTKDREHYFGEIKNGEMILNDLGKKVKEEWEKTPTLRPDMNLELGEFVVMPNHFHAIIVIGENEYNSPVVETRCIASKKNNIETQCIASKKNNIETQCIASKKNNIETRCIASKKNNIETQCIASKKNNIETQCIASLQEQNKFQPQSKNLASIVRGFKSAVTMYARKNEIPFSWQSRFHDRIIRDNIELNAISRYILYNPQNWQEDEYA